MPPVAVHVAGTDTPMATSSLTPTFLRVFGVPSGVSSTVLVFRVQAGAALGGGDNGGFAGAFCVGAGAPSAGFGAGGGDDGFPAGGAGFGVGVVSDSGMRENS